MIILIALLINFSLFTTRVVIDVSNILAKVFYNNIDSKYENNDPATGVIGQKSISEGLFDIFDPQKIFTQGTYNQDGGTTLFIIITVMMIGIVLYTAYIFFSVGLIFVSRVVMLWLCMIFSPIAFISYTVPFDIPGFGHREWWKNLLQNAFLAPIFVFMLYIIVMFAQFLSDIAHFENGTGITQKILTVMIPFIILMTLLMKSKEIAVKMSGEMGAAMMKAGAVVGGLALGGAALGGAALMRGTAGAFMKGASTGDTAASAERMASNRAILADPNAKWHQKLKASAQIAQGKVQTASGYSALQSKMGDKLRTDQAQIHHARHARQDLDTAASDVTHGSKKKFSELNQTEKDDAIVHISRKEEMRKRKLGNRTWGQLDDEQRQSIDETITNDLLMKTSTGDKKVKDAKRKEGVFETLLQSGIHGSYDARNLSKVTANEGDTALNKFASGLTGVIATTLILPFDCIKIQMQLRSEAGEKRVSFVSVHNFLIFYK